MVLNVLEERFLRLGAGAVGLVDEENARHVRVAVHFGDARSAKGFVDAAAQALLGGVQLEVVRAVTVLHRRPAAGALAARLRRVFLVVPTTGAHAADARRSSLAAAVLT